MENQIPEFGEVKKNKADECNTGINTYQNKGSKGEE